LLQATSIPVFWIGMLEGAAINSVGIDLLDVLQAADVVPALPI
jgi:hypothetical protein